MTRPRTDHLKPWQPGDPVGCGEVYLPDQKTRDAYADAIRQQWLEFAAQMICGMTSINDRRRAIAKYKPEEQELLKARVLEIWEKRQNAA